jgi:hypothetical protein
MKKSKREDYVRYIQDIAAPVNMMLANETGTRREEIWKAIADQVRLQYADSTNGPASFNNDSIYVDIFSHLHSRTTVVKG